MTDFAYNPDDPLSLIPGENERAHLALHDYDALGPDRTLERLSAIYRSATTVVPTRQTTTLKNWSTRYQWQERLAQQQELRLAAERERRDAVWAARREQIRDESWELAQRLRKRAIELLDHPTVEEHIESKDGKTITIVKPSRWAQRDIPAIAETFDKLARLSAGMDTEQIRIEGLTPQNLSDLSDEELIALEAKIRRKQR
jgi:hypothetical protein